MAEEAIQQLSRPRMTGVGEIRTANDCHQTRPRLTAIGRLLPPSTTVGTATSEGVRRVRRCSIRAIEGSSSTKWVWRVCGRSTWAGIRPSSSEWIRRIGCGATGALEGPATTKRIRGVRGLCKYCAGYAEQQGREGFHGGLFQRIGHANVVKSCGLIGRA